MIHTLGNLTLLTGPLKVAPWLQEPVLGRLFFTPEQRAIYDRMMALRGHMRGPFAVWLRNRFERSW
mgnify:CR=1 FL=1